jgi:2-aminoadipate transaminase
VLLDPGDVVITERPYLLLQSFAAVSPRYGAIDNTDARRARTRAPRVRPKPCSVVPNFQNPSGATMTDERRRHLPRSPSATASSSPRRSAALGSAADRRSRPPELTVVGSTEGARAGFGRLASPTELHAARAGQAGRRSTPPPPRSTAFDLRDSTFLPAHIAELRACYATRCDTLARALRTTLGDQVEFDEPDGGFFLWVRMPGVDTTELFSRALGEGVAFVPGAAFATDDSCDDRARLSFASLSTDDLALAVERLRGAISPPFSRTGTGRRGPWLDVGAG